MNRTRQLALALLGLCCLSLSAEPLSLREAITQALNHNYALQIEHDNKAIAEENTLIAEAAFDPQLSFSTRTSKSKNPIASSSLTGANRLITDSENYSASTEKTFGTTGTELSLSTQLSSSESNSSNATLNPDVTSEVGIAIEQPLLKNRGRINLAPLAQARTRHRIAALELQQYVLNTIEATEEAYWRLAAEHARLDLKQSSRELAEALLEESRQRLELGVATQTEVLQARAQLAAQEEDIIATNQAIENASDTLAALMGSLNADTSDILQPNPFPEKFPELPDYHESLKASLELNESSRIGKEEIALRRIEAQVTNNARLPDLDMTLGAAYLGRDERAWDSYDSTSRREAYRWNAGLSLSFPWGLQAEQAEHRVALKRLSRAEKAWQDIRQQLIRQLRQAWRDLKMNKQRLESAQTTLAFTEEAYASERARYSEGLASFRDTLEAQRDLDNARIRALDAHLSVLQARTRLDRLDGSLLPRHGYDWSTLDNPLPKGGDSLRF